MLDCFLKNGGRGYGLVWVLRLDKLKGRFARAGIGESCLSKMYIPTTTQTMYRVPDTSVVVSRAYKTFVTNGSLATARSRVSCSRVVAGGKKANVLDT